MASVQTIDGMSCAASSHFVSGDACVGAISGRTGNPALVCQRSYLY